MARPSPSDGPPDRNDARLEAPILQRVGIGSKNAPRLDRAFAGFGTGSAVWRRMAPMEAGGGPRALLIDDDVELCELVTEYLSTEGFEIEVVHDGKSGVEKAVSGKHRLVILDVMLPGLGGFEALRQIRAESDVPVIMLTARGDDVDRIVGLEMGADDYLPKPFNPRELVARIGAVLRRARATSSDSSGPVEPETLRVGDVEMEPAARLVRRNGTRIDLTAVEFDLLEMLLRGAGRVLRREEMSRQVLGRAHSPFDRSLDMHISHLRRKLGERPDGGQTIQAVRSVGYVYTLPARTEPGEE